MIDINYKFSKEIADKHHSLILESKQFCDWLAQQSRNFVIRELYFQQADIIKRSGKDHLLFLKLKADAVDKDGRKAHGITLLRGDAVGILVVLICEGQEYLLLVEQPRFAIGESRFLEIPAGMLDDSNNAFEVAIAELKEEANIYADLNEIIDLNTLFAGKDSRGVVPSGGLMEEFVKLLLYKKEISREELDSYRDKEQSYLVEEENIITRIFLIDDVLPKLTDAKSLIAILMYQDLKRQAKI